MDSTPVGSSSFKRGSSCESTRITFRPGERCERSSEVASSSSKLALVEATKKSKFPKEASALGLSRSSSRGAVLDVGMLPRATKRPLAQWTPRPWEARHPREASLASPQESPSGLDRDVREALKLQAVPPSWHWSRPPRSQSSPRKPLLSASQYPPAEVQFWTWACCQEPPRDHFPQGHQAEEPQGLAGLGQ